MIPVVKVTARVYTQDGKPSVGAIVTMRLSTTEKYMGYIVPMEVSAKTDSNGSAVLSVFPNALGSEGSEYRVTIQHKSNIYSSSSNNCCGGEAVSRVITAYAVVPNEDCNLSDIMELPTYAPRGNGEVITAEVAAYAEQAASARDAAQSYAEQSQLLLDNTTIKTQEATAAKDAALQAEESAEAHRLAAEEAKTQAQTTADNFEAEVVGRVENTVDGLTTQATNTISQAKTVAIEEIEDAGTNATNEFTATVAGLQSQASQDISAQGQLWQGKVEEEGQRQIGLISDTSEDALASMDLRIEEVEAIAKQITCAGGNASVSAQEAKLAAEQAKASETAAGLSADRAESYSSLAKGYSQQAQASQQHAKDAERYSIQASQSAIDASSSSISARASSDSATVSAGEAKNNADYVSSVADDIKNSIATEAGKLISQDIIEAAVADATADAQLSANQAADSALEAQTAVDNASQAIAQANTAVQEANEAVDRADTALDSVGAAMVDINDAIKSTNKAVVDATAQADRATTQAGLAETQAEASANSATAALSSANKAQQIIDNSQVVIDRSEEALLEANTAIANAEIANNKALNAITDVDNAKVELDASVTNAQSAVTAAQDAVTEAQQAVTDAQQEVAAVGTLVSDAEAAANLALGYKNDTLALYNDALSDVTAAKDTAVTAVENKGNEVNAELEEIETRVDTLGRGYEQKSEENYLLAKSWSQSDTAPDPTDPTSKSAKSWAELAEQSLGTATQTELGRVRLATAEEIANKNGEGVITASNLSTGAFVGQVIQVTTSSTWIPEGTLPTDGTTLNKLQFSALWENYLIAGKLDTKTFAEYEAELSAKGKCASWGVDAATGRFRVPLIPDKAIVQQAMTDAEIGKSYNAGLPNISGSISFIGMEDIGLGVGYTHGAFVASSPDGYGISDSSFGGASQNNTNRILTLDASRSSAEYGNSTTVQTNALSIRHFVVVSTGSINQAMMDWSAWATALAGRADTDLENLTNTGKSSLIELLAPNFARRTQVSTSNLVEITLAYTSWVYVWQNVSTSLGGPIISNPAQTAAYSIGTFFRGDLDAKAITTPPILLAKGTTFVVGMSPNHYQQFPLLPLDALVGVTPCIGAV